MNDRARTRLVDAAAALRRVERFSAGLAKSGYMEDELRRAAVERQFEIVGEALTGALRDDTALGVALPGARRAIEFRNRVIHGYDSVDHEIVGDVATNDGPALLAAIEDLLGR